MKRKSFLAKASMMLLAVLFSLTGAKAQNAAPTNVAASEVTASSAKISWDGEADSYDLRYATSASGAVLFSDDFESGMGKWTVYTEGEAQKEAGWYAYQTTSTTGLEFPAHSGEYVASAWSWASNAYDANNWLVTPQVTLNGILSFWVRTNAGYPDKYEVLLSTTDNAEESFTVVLQAMAPAPNTGSWEKVQIDLSSYAGQQGYIAIHHKDNDMNYLIIDDFAITENGEWTTVTGVTSPYTIEGLSETTAYVAQVQGTVFGGISNWVSVWFTTIEDIPTPTGLAASNVGPYSAVLSWTENGIATSWVISVYDETEEDSFGSFTISENPYTLTGLTPNHTYSVNVRPAGDNNKWSEQLFFETFLPVPNELAVDNITTTTADVTWKADAAATSSTLEYVEGTIPTWNKYDNGTLATNVGLGSSNFSWGIMFPAGSYAGNLLSKVSVYDVEEMTGSVSIYNDGDTAPENDAIGTKPVTLTGAKAFVEVSFDNITIDPTKNLWVIVSNESGAGYPAAACTDDLDDVNGRWVEISGNWHDLGEVGLPGYAWLLRAEIGSIDPSAVEWTTVANATSPYSLTGLTPSTNYSVRVNSVYGEGDKSEWVSAIFTTESENPVPANIEADLAADGATLTWEGKGDSYNVQYRTAEKEEAIFVDNFEGDLGKWTLVTAGEGPGWIIEDKGLGNAATAYSWNGDTYDADNWLITPAIELQGVLKFKTYTIGNYPDSYEVLLSTTGNAVEDFTTTLQKMGTGGLSTWQDVNIDLSAYAGQTGYIAIHHVSKDCYVLIVDDFGVYNSVPAGEWQDMAVTEATATLSGLATNDAYEYQIQSVKDGNTSEWSEAGEFALLTLDSDADNTSLISTFDGKLAHITLANRTLYKNGTWNTICLPFTLTDLTDTPLEGADVRTLSGVNVSDYTITLNFTNEGAIETAWGKYYGGVPYLLKWDDDTDIVNPEFANVIIESDLSKMSYGNAIGVTFKGTYAPLSFEEEDKSILFVGAENKLYWPLAGAKIGAMRGYFEIDGTEAEIAEASAKQFILNFGDEDATSIETISTSVESESIYNLAGQKMSKMQKGINIVNGKKILK